jgi:hypothetical protein
MFDIWMNVLTNKVWTYKWTNVTQISHLPINLCLKCVFSAQYQCVKHTNFAWFPLLSCGMLSLWCKLWPPTKIIIFNPLTIARCFVLNFLTYISAMQKTTTNIKKHLLYLHSDMIYFGHLFHMTHCIIDLFGMAPMLICFAWIFL